MKTLSEFEPIISTVLRLLAKETRFTCRPALSSILKEHPRLVVVFSHASPLSWIPAPFLLATHVVLRGGGHRRPIGVMDRFFYSLPGFKQLATFLTQSERPLEFNEIVEHFSSLEDVDLAIFPEGSNCFFGLPNEVQSFRSPRFIEIAIRARAPILVCVHRGSENWGLPIRLQTEWLKVLNDLPAPVVQWLDTYLKFEERAKRAEMLTLPVVPTRMERFDMMCKLYHPEVRPNKAQIPREVLELESNRIRDMMIEMLEEIDTNRARDGIIKNPNQSSGVFSGLRS